MKYSIRKIIIIFYQIPILYIFYNLFRFYFYFLKNKNEKKKIVIGVDETARSIFLLGKIFQSSYTVNFLKHPFYNDNYDFQIYGIIKRIIIGPILLAYFSTFAETFIYIWSSGFLLDRAYEFQFLKKMNKFIINYFCGSEIRSLVKTKLFYDQRGEDSYVNYLNETDDLQQDENRKLIAQVSAKYADIIFNWSVDNLSYLKKTSYPWPYFVDLSSLNYNFTLPDDLTEIVIIHAPSNPIVKGTPLVKAAIKKLQKNGYKFHYIELNKVPHNEVIKYLLTSNIVLNEFYLATPGVFGIEAMATGNALLTSADRTIENDLPADCEGAWQVTHYWEIYDNLKLLLDNPELIEKYAKRGRSFVERHYTIEKVRAYYLKIFSQHNIPMQ